MINMMAVPRIKELALYKYPDTNGDGMIDFSFVRQIVT